MPPDRPATPASPSASPLTAMPSVLRYDRLSRTLHWIFAAAIVYTMVAGYALHVIEDSRVWHVISVTNMSVATLLLVLFPVRCLWAVIRTSPHEVSGAPQWQYAVARCTHVALYFLTGLVLVSGYLMVPDGYLMFGMWHIHTPFAEGPLTAHWFDIHRNACYALTASLTLHLAGVFKHQWISKTDVLGRMT